MTRVRGTAVFVVVAAGREQCNNNNTCCRKQQLFSRQLPQKQFTHSKSITGSIALINGPKELHLMGEKSILLARRKSRRRGGSCEAAVAASSGSGSNSNLNSNSNNSSILLICCSFIMLVTLLFAGQIDCSPPIDYFVYTNSLMSAPVNGAPQHIRTTLPKIESIYSIFNNQTSVNDNDAAAAKSTYYDELSRRVLSLIRNSSHQHDNNLVDLEATQFAWHLMERQAKMYMKSRIESLNDTLEELLKEAQVSDECLGSIRHWLNELIELRHWATLMWNSWGDLPSNGLLAGSFTDLGSYKGCMSIEDDLMSDPSIGQPQYCTIDFQPLVPTRPRFHSIFKQILDHHEQHLTRGDFEDNGKQVDARDSAHGYASRRYKELNSIFPVKTASSSASRLTLDADDGNNSVESGSTASISNKYSKRTIVHTSLTNNQTTSTSTTMTSNSNSNQTQNHLTLKAEALIALAQKAQYFYYVKFRLGACLPAKCSSKDVESLAQTAGQRAILQLSQVNCMKKEPVVINNYQLVAIWILSSLALIAILGTIVDLLGYKENKETNCLVNWLLPFSTWTNARRLFDFETAGTHGDLECVHGLRFFSMIWVIYGHTILYMEYQSFTHFFDVVETQIPSFIMLPTLNANFSVDTFFVISGILTTYVTWEITKGDARKFNKFAFFISRYIRLTPQLAIVILCFFLLPLLGDGPMFKQVTDKQAQLCYKNWAINLLYLQNYINSEKLCIDPSWWLSIEMSFHIISMVVIVVMIQNVRLGMWVNFLIAFTLTLWGSIIHYTNGFAIQYLPSIPQRYEIANEQTKLFFHRPYPHAASYFIGIALGYVLANKTIKKLSKSQLLQGWTICFIGIFVSLWGSYYWNLGAPYTQLQASIYYNLCQVLWPLSISWIIFACSLGYGGIINSILAARCFVPLGRVTYMTYLSHALIIYYHSGTLSIPVEPSMLFFLYLFLANTCIALALGVILTILYESPILNLQKLLFTYLTARFDPTVRDSQRNRAATNNNHHPNVGYSTTTMITNHTDHVIKNGNSASCVTCCLLLDSNSNKQPINGTNNCNGFHKLNMQQQFE